MPAISADYLHNTLSAFADRGIEPLKLMRDLDTMPASAFLSLMENHGLAVVKLEDISDAEINVLIIGHA